MQLSIEISKYPLTPNYIPEIQSFIDRLNTYSTIKVLTNTMSTQIFGEYDDVMTALKNEMKTSFEKDVKQIMVVKFINSDLRP